MRRPDHDGLLITFPRLNITVVQLHHSDCNSIENNFHPPLLCKHNTLAAVCNNAGCRNLKLPSLNSGLIFFFSQPAWWKKNLNWRFLYRVLDTEQPWWRWSVLSSILIWLHLSSLLINYWAELHKLHHHKCTAVSVSAYRSLHDESRPNPP